MSSDDHPASVPTLLYRRAGVDLPKRELRAFANAICTEVASGRSFTCLFTDDRELQRLNREFLGSDSPTDVLSFPSEDGSGAGDLAISVARAREQATGLNHSLSAELRILMLHGLLHLLGMDHEKDRGAMARSEKRWRLHFGLPVGLIERARS